MQWCGCFNILQEDGITVNYEVILCEGDHPSHWCLSCLQNQKSQGKLQLDWSHMHS